ncbi:MAG: UDP-N-acetylmuramate--L-alanine ligase, partial [Muribaculaceae bacterium]|nr:UDP-N-acetylmuramate--L-alanine ligase [Muribaculaceae bacterium]
ALYPDRNITVAFQPHLYTRTRDFAPQFADALSAADAVVLTDLYPAREEPIEGVDSSLILRQVTCADKNLVAKHDLVDWLKNRNFDILLACGAGDMSMLLPGLCQEIKQH